MTGPSPSSPTPSARRGRDKLDPDTLAHLEEERDFLLRSLDDLEEEYAAGDVEEDDYRALRDDYTQRAATVLRSIEQRRAARAAATSRRRSPARVMAWGAGVLVFGVLAGLGVARAAGDRGEGEFITGGIRESISQRMFGCEQLVSQLEIRDALECYDGILEEQPNNREAISYRAWALVLAGLPEVAWPYLDRAVMIDPDYPDVRAFRAIVLNAWCRPDEVLAELDAFDDARPLEEMRQLVAGYQLRERATDLLEVRLGEPSVADPPTPIGEVGADEYDQCPVLADAGVLERTVTDPEPDPADEP
ncbi:MAG: tetratricopeptide repeat protein [Acidimicrobiales bacterium]